MSNRANLEEEHEKNNRNFYKNRTTFIQVKMQWRFEFKASWRENIKRDAKKKYRNRNAVHTIL